MRNFSAGTLTTATAGYFTVLGDSTDPTTGHGVFIADIAGDTAYGLYQESADNNNYFAGRVGIGTTNPGAKLEIGGQVKITGGAPGVGKVLTSDASGLATWEIGVAGPTGPTGPQGIQGVPGAQGPTGPGLVGGNLELVASTATTGNVLKDGTRFLHNFGTRNTSLGMDAGNFIPLGIDNTASGYNALSSITSGDSNTAIGSFALQNTVTGFDNLASGAYALRDNTSGTNNTASGALALRFNTAGTNNTASGHNALRNNSSGLSNTAVGSSADAEDTQVQHCGDQQHGQRSQRAPQ